MEKIQSALAKARAERNAKGPVPAKPAPDAPVVRTPAATPQRTEALSGSTEAWQALPKLAFKPKLMKKHRIVALDGGREAAGIDMMRTRVLQQMRANGWRRLAITSPTAECGKSTVAVNLAMSLQRQSDLKTILMELDLRRPALTKILGVEGEMSFAHVLDGTQDFADNALRYGPNLAVSANHRAWRDAAELLGGANIPEILSDIEAAYAPDVMLFDMPPMLINDDVMAFVRHVDCVLLVAGAETTSIKQIDICEQDLASQTNVMGVVLNKCRYMGPDYDYGAYAYA
jgi:protein-tyrosine kinase|tara:strand:+ start:299 stop:1159 length:861 start_codon:yes stop_codon:yes gene_type:complete